MATKQPSKANQDGSLQTVSDSLDSFRFTYNVRSNKESITIRTNDEQEAEALREKWKEVISPTRPKLEYLNIGDDCHTENCGGSMELRSSTNRKTGQAYAYLRCTKACGFTAYVETQPNKDKATA